MLFEIFALGGTIGIAVALFVIMIKHADNPVKAILVTIVHMYLMLTLYIYALNYLFNRKNRGKSGPLYNSQE